MDQNQTTDNQVLDQNTDNDLQKAIDDITNTTNVDPVFSDPVAAPSSIPEGDTGELGEPVGPFPTPAIETPETPIMTPPQAPTEISLPEPDMAAATHDTPMPEPATNTLTSTPEINSAPTPTIEQPMPDLAPQSLSTSEVKQAALRDLIPLLGKVHMDGAQKFKIYRNIFDQLRDYTVLEPAYQAAREIPDETERAEALLYLVESIDKM